MRSLKEIYENHNGGYLHKWEHYIEIYERHFEKYRGTEFTMLEIGIAHGGSLEMWRDYFGPKAHIVGVDVNPECKQFESGNTKVYIGSQEDRKFLQYLKVEVPKIDVLLDDGGHTMSQQLVTFDEMFDHVQENGIYACEDLHTSYWNAYGGGFRKKSTFIEFSKQLIDYIHGWHAEEPDKAKMLNKLTKSIYGLHFYDSILVIEKRPITPPKNSYKGAPRVENLNQYMDYGHKKSITQKIKGILKSRAT